MSLHACGTGGRVESLATRYPLSTFQPKSVDGGISGLARSGSDSRLFQCVHAKHLKWEAVPRAPYICWTVALGLHLSLSRSQHGTTYRRTLLHREPWTLWALLLRGAEVAYALWRTCTKPFSWCGQNSRRQCHIRLLRGKQEELSTPIQGMKVSVWFHGWESTSSAWTCLPSSTTVCTSCWRRMEEVAAECRCLVLPQRRLQSQHECSVTPPWCRLPRGWLWAFQFQPMGIFSCAKSTSNYNDLVTRCLGNQFVGK